MDYPLTIMEGVYTTLHGEFRCQVSVKRFRIIHVWQVTIELSEAKFRKREIIKSQVD